MNMTTRLFPLFILFFVTSCTSPRYILDAEKTSFSELLSGFEEAQNKLKSFRGQSRISIDTPEYSGSFFADVLYNDNDSILIDVSGPFGIDVGKMFLGKNRFIFFNQFSNQFYSGDTENFKNRNFLQFPLKIHEISNFFVGKETIKNMKILNYKVDGDLFFINGKNGSMSYNIWMDDLTGRIKKIEYLEGDKLILIKEYDKFFKINNAYFPKHIKLTRPIEKQIVSVFYNQLVLNQEILPEEFQLKISDTARQIDLNLIELENKENL